MRRHGPAGPGVLLALVLTLALPAPAPAAPAATDRRVHPADVSGLPSYVQRVAPSIVALKVRNVRGVDRSEEHTSELQSLRHLVCRLLLEKKKKKHTHNTIIDRTL